jgi:ribonuclease HI
MLAICWFTWLVEQNHHKAEISPLPDNPHKNFRGKKRICSPFQLMRSVAHHWDMFKDDIGVEAGCMFPFSPPWSTSLPPSDHPDDEKIFWPVFGAAGTRDNDQRRKARSYCHQQSALAKRSILQNGEGSIIFTDGSAYTDAIGGGGCGVVSHSLPAKITTPVGFPLGKLATNYGCELKAIEIALKKALETNSQNTFIFSDCQSAVNSARSELPGSGSLCYWTLVSQIASIKAEIRSLGRRVVVAWIPGHANFDMNNAADEQAKAAAAAARASPLPNFLIRKPYQVAKSFIKRRLVVWWQSWWDSTNRARALYKLHPKVNTPPPFELTSIKNDRRLQVCIDRLRLNVCTTNSILFRVGSKSTARCDHCPTVVDSEEHRMFECHHSNTHRQKLLDAIKRINPNLTLSKETLLGFVGVPATARANVANALTDFLTNSKLVELFVWSPPKEPSEPGSDTDSEIDE